MSLAVTTPNAVPLFCPLSIFISRYAEFVTPQNRNHTAPPYFHELFDLDADPWELHNVFSAASAEVKADLAARVEKLFRCQGASCN